MKLYTYNTKNVLKCQIGVSSNKSLSSWSRNSLVCSSTCGTFIQSSLHLQYSVQSNENFLQEHLLVLQSDLHWHLISCLIWSGAKERSDVIGKSKLSIYSFPTKIKGVMPVSNPFLYLVVNSGMLKKIPGIISTFWVLIPATKKSAVL